MAKTCLRLFEYIIILQPKVDSKGNITDEGKLIDRGDVLTTDEDKALIKIHRAIPEDLLEMLDRVVVVFRPFEPEEDLFAAEREKPGVPKATLDVTRGMTQSAVTGTPLRTWTNVSTSPVGSGSNVSFYQSQPVSTYGSASTLAQPPKQP